MKLSREALRPPLEQVARELGGDEWRAHVIEAVEILEQAEDVIAWRLGFALPDHVLRLGKLLAQHHLKQRTLRLLS